MSVAPRAIGIDEMALRVVARPGAWFALMTPEPDVRHAAERIVHETEALGGSTPALLDATRGAVALAKAAREAPGKALVIAGLDAFDDDAWRHLDMLRSQLVRDEPVVLVLSKFAFERLMNDAPNIASLLGAAVSTLDPAADELTADEKEQRLRALRAWSGLSDDEMIGRAERGELSLSPEHAEWLVLLGRGDLLDRA